MKNLLWIFPLILTGFLINADDANKAGLNLAVSADVISTLNIIQFFNNIKDIAIDFIANTIKNMPSTAHFNIPILDGFALDFYILDSNFTKIGIDKAATNIKMDSTLNAIILEISNLTIEYKINVSFNSTGNLWFGNGEGNVKIDDFTLKFGFEPYTNVETGLLCVNVTQLKVEPDPKNFHIDFAGADNDIFWALNQISDLVIPFILDFASKIDKGTLEQLSSVIDGLLETIPFQINVYKHLWIDYTLLQEPDIINGFLTLLFNGTMFLKDEENPISPLAVLPTHSDQGLPLQLFLSEYTLNTVFYSLYMDDFLIFLISPEMIPATMPFKLNTQFISVFIPQITNYYDLDTHMEVELNATTYPLIDITNAGATMSLSVSMDIMAHTEADTKDLVLAIQMEMSLGLTGSIRNDSITGSIAAYEFTISGTDSNIGPVNMDNLSLLINTVMKLAVPQVNDLMAIGFPLPNFMNISVADAHLQMHDGYMSASLTPMPLTADDFQQLLGYPDCLKVDDMVDREEYDIVNNMKEFTILKKNRN